MKIESNKNWTTCLRLNTGDGSPRVFLLNSHFLGSVPSPTGFLIFFNTKLTYMIITIFDNHVSFMIRIINDTKEDVTKM